MKTCPDLDRITTLEQAADWGLYALVEHVATCDECRNSLLDLEGLRDELTATADVRAGFTEEVTRTLGGEQPAAAARRYPSPADLVNIGLAGLTATFAIAIAASGAPSSVSPASVLAGGLVAAAFYALADVFAGSR